ncbi:MAG: insulinase family protein [Actinobacteria bacterium]|nr:insulinase family protein [Actinomycetota bacterium]
MGSRDETGSLTGVTHFIEHLLFKGSERYSAERIAQVFDTLGGELNAATSKEYVLVYGRFVDDQLPKAMDVLVDMLLTPTFTDLDNEREVILEEIAMYEDSPQDLIHDLLTETIFGAHPLGHAVLGTRETIGGMSEAEVRAYHQRHFRFSDMVVAAAGNVDHDELRELILAGHPRSDSNGLVPVHTPAEITPRRAFMVKETEQVHVCLGGRGLPRNHEKRFVLTVLDSLLGGSLSSRLFQEVREKRGLVYSIYSFASQYREAGMAGVYFGCRPDRLATVIETVQVELARIVTEAVPTDEVERAKEHVKGRLLLGLESTNSRMSRLGKGVLTGAELLDLDEITRRVESVTAEEILELAADLFEPSALSVAGIGTDETGFRAAFENWVPGNPIDSVG